MPGLRKRSAIESVTFDNLNKLIGVVASTVKAGEWAEISVRQPWVVQRAPMVGRRYA